MNHASIKVFSPIVETPRIMQLRGIFDLPAEEHSSQTWEVSLPLSDHPWNIGLIVGPSGCGKSTIARQLWPDKTQANNLTWPTQESAIDAFPQEMPIKDIVTLLSSVGFSSPPAWLRPFHVLSTGQQFRVTIARILAEQNDLAVVDEFTSVVDRTVAQIGSAAIAKTVRGRQQKFIAVTCHEDVEPWLNPDWTYRPDVNEFTWRLLQPRPNITIVITRTHSSTWKVFKHHHYLNTEIATAAVCFIATWKNRPVCFTAWLPFFGKATHPTRREHRTVTLPDYQGVGIGHAVSTHIASMWKALHLRPTSTTTHPAFIAARNKDPDWRLTRAPSFASRSQKGKVQHATTRLTAGFEYIGPPMTTTKAQALLNG